MKRFIIVGLAIGLMLLANGAWAADPFYMNFIRDTGQSTDPNAGLNTTTGIGADTGRAADSTPWYDRFKGEGIVLGQETGAILGSEAVGSDSVSGQGPDAIAGSEAVAAGNEFAGSGLQSVSSTDLSVTGGAPSVDHSVSMVGSGRATAEAIVESNNGESQNDYEDSTTAAGDFSFVKGFSYQSTTGSSSTGYGSPFDRIFR